MNLTIIIFLILSVALCFLYMPYAKKQRKHARNKLEPLISDPNAVRVALWINLDKVNDHVFTGEFHYWTGIKKAMLNSEPVGVALFEPGKYHFIVSSNSNNQYKNVGMFVELLAGQTYQLGCNEDGPYLVIDPEPTRYDYKY